MIEMLNVHQQRLHMRGEEMKEFYRQLQSAMGMQTSKGSTGRPLLFLLMFT